MNIFVVCPMVQYLRSTVSSVIAESEGYAYSILNFSRYCQIVFQPTYTTSHSCRSGSDSTARVPGLGVSDILSFANFMV